MVARGRGGEEEGEEEESQDGKGSGGWLHNSVNVPNTTEQSSDLAHSHCSLGELVLKWHPVDLGFVSWPQTASRRSTLHAQENDLGPHSERTSRTRESTSPRLVRNTEPQAPSQT